MTKYRLCVILNMNKNFLERNFAMKKIVSLILVFVLMMSLASCMKVHIILPEVGGGNVAVENTTAAAQ